MRVSTEPHHTDPFPETLQARLSASSSLSIFRGDSATRTDRFRGCAGPVLLDFAGTVCLSENVQEGKTVIPFVLIALTYGAITLGSKIAALIRADRDGELLGGLAGLMILIILAWVMLWLGVLPKAALTAELNCPWLHGC